MFYSSTLTFPAISRRICWCLLALALLSAGARSARCAPAETQTRAHFKQGAAFYAEGAYDRALAEYQAAYAILPLPDLLFNIGQAQRMRGSRKEAIESYRRFTAQKSEGAASDLARRYIAALSHELDEESRQPAVRTSIDRDDDPKRASPIALSAVAPSAKPPTYKKWWVWTIVGAGVVGVGLGVGLGIALPQRGFHSTLHPELSEMALVRF